MLDLVKTGIQIRPFADLSVVGLRADEAACGHYRVTYPLEYLHRGGAHAQWVEQITPQFLDQFDTLLVQRQHDPQIIALLRELKKRGKTLIYEIDDNVHAVHPNSVAFQHYRPGSQTLRNVEECIRLCDALFVTTPELASQYRAYNQRIYVLPNFIDFGIRDWEAEYPRRPALQERIDARRAATGTEPVVIGWAGSITHQDDWAPLQGNLKRVLEKYPHAIFAMVSAYQIMEIFKAKLGLPEEQLVCLDPTDLNGFPEIPAQFDLGLAPVVNTTFNRAKSDLKLLEYGARKVPYVASQLAPYNRFHMESGQIGGFIAERDGGWEKCISRLVEDNALRQSMGTALYDYVRKNCSYQGNIYRWAEAIREVRDLSKYNPDAVRQVIVNERPGRNEKCPCGSGLKSKRCCRGAWG